VDHTQLLWVLGANPLASNGSLMTAPGIGRRLRAIQERGGRVVVFDPRRSETAAVSDEHVALRPGSDAHLLLAVANVLLAESRVALGRLAPHVAGLDAFAAAIRDLSPEWAATRCGVPAHAIRRLARELSASPAAAVYGRIGTCTQEFGVLASFAVDVLNVLTGNLDRPGGALFTLPATGALHTTGTPGRGKGHTFGRYASRVRGFPEFFRELPNAVIAEEILTPGPGQIRAFVTMGGNPVLSTPSGHKLAEAFATLDLLISLEYSNGGGNPIVTLYTITNVVNFPQGQTNDFTKVTDQKTIRVVHGHGTGQLRRAIAALLKDHPQVSSFHTAPPNQGGGGVTVVELKE
jgi:anaerobic selenocysteine-containing dehydrogenase